MDGQVAIAKLSARNHAKITKNVKPFGRKTFRFYSSAIPQCTLNYVNMVFL